MNGTATQQQQELLTVKEVAAILRVTDMWVYLHSTGRVEPRIAYMKLGKLLRFRSADVDAFLAAWQK